MDGAFDQLEKYVGHRILIIDRDQLEVDRLRRILSTPNEPTGTMPDRVMVGTLIEAKAYIERDKPTIAVIDPAIDSSWEVLDFIAHVREAYPNVIWLINTTDYWWTTNEPILESHPFGSRLKSYYRRSKTPNEEEAKKSLLSALNLCRDDFVLELIRDTASDIQASQDKRMTQEQLGKFVSKAIRPVLSLFVETRGIFPRSKIAFVSMGCGASHKQLYEVIVAPTLHKAGYQAIAMPYQLRPGPILDAFLAAIHEASLFIADLTEIRLDIMLEMGAAWASRVPLIFFSHCSKLAMDQLPLPGARIESTSDEDLREKLSAAIDDSARP